MRVVTAQPFYPHFERFQGYGRDRRHDTLDGGKIPILRVPTIVPKNGRVALRALSDLNFALQGAIRSRTRRTRSVISISPGVPWVAVVGRAFTAKGGQHLAVVHDVQSGLASSLGLLPGGLASVLGRLERAGLERADHVTALTEEMVCELRRLGVRRPMSVTPLWATVRADPALVTDGPVSVQYSGNFGAKQGVAILADIAAELRRRAPDLPLVLRGAGPKFDDLRSVLRGDGVTFEPPVEHEELPLALAKSAIHLVLVSSGSGQFALPSKVVNTLAVGSLVVAMADAGSPLHRIGEQMRGLTTVPVGDVDRLVDAVVRLARDPHLRHRRLESQQQAALTFDRDCALGALEARLAQ